MSARVAGVETAAIADAVREARLTRAPLRIVGAGSWLDAGRPVRETSTLDVGTGGEVVEYEPGDLTLTARAATTLDALNVITRAQGQWLPLDPFGAPEGTIGATVATASAGPLASAYGTPRDQLLGCEFVTGAGDVVRAGGRVVKNVAGFDLVRLVCGSWGTLGVLTELTVRLRALPEVDATLAIPVGADTAWRWLRRSEFTPLAAELVSPTLARALGVGSEATFLLRLGGNDALVRAAIESATSLGLQQRVPENVWQTLATSEPRAAAVVRLSTLPSKVAALWERASLIVERVGGFAHATLQRGIVRCVIPYADTGEDETARVRGIIGALRLDATCIAERLPPSLWTSLVGSAVAGALSKRVLEAFDPARLLNPGILGELE